jgi:membrane magnesium transporter 1
LDITIEALISVILVSTGLVLGAEKLKPITHGAWAGQIEKEGGGKNPYKNLEIRSGFWDVRVGHLACYETKTPRDIANGFLQI